MTTFKNQIIEDLKDYEDQYPNIPFIHKPEWAFNFWILDKLFSVDEDLIESQIIDYNDLGTDCYVWHEDSHDLYLIQNKYYNETTKIDSKYIANDFLTRTIGALEKGTYSRSEELQRIYNKYHSNDDFRINFYLYITNDTVLNDKKIEKLIKTFNNNHIKYVAKIFGLSDIEKLYYDQPIENKKTLTFDIKTINKGTTLNIDNAAYQMTQALDARYALTPVTSIYQLFEKAKEEEYSLFNENIREYLGSYGNVNKQIANTLRNPVDRKNFFFYNNGITIIVNNMGPIQRSKGSAYFNIENPQIVNGCQTVSTISETLGNLPESTLENDFKDTYVMAKFLKIDEDNNPEMKTLYENIVKYNNSQNAIQQKSFEANRNEFKRLQTEFLRRGILVCVKQSDKHQFKTKYKVPTELINRNASLFKKFGLENKKKTTDFIIDLEKLLQIILAFESTTQDAVQNKSKLLKNDTSQNKTVLNFITNNDVTINDIVSLYLLFMRAESDKKNGDGKVPIPFFLINCFSHYECKGEYRKISEHLKDSESINRIMRLYTPTIKGYYTKWIKDNPEKAYNDMIKNEIDFSLMDDCLEMAKSMCL